MTSTFLNDIPPKGKLVIMILVITTVTLLLTYFAGGIWFSILSGFISAFLLFISKAIWLSADHGKNLIRRISLGLILMLSGTYFGWSQFIASILTPIIKTYFPNVKIPTNAPSTAILIFAFAVIWLVNYLMRDKTVMRQHDLAIDKEFPEKDFKTKLEHFAKVLSMELNNIDLETNWNDYYFTPVDAEVEVINNNIRKKKVTDLLRAIRSDKKSQVFLVLGDPGSGKSIALRQLAKDLLNEVKITGKVPIYINLKEWKISNRWTKENPPTVQSLYDFIFNNLKSRGDIFTIEFLNLYFKKMYEHGRVFFLLDSFDEIPDVLDADEKSWIIDELSGVFYKFLAGAHESRGVLSSRIFRKPTNKFKTQTIFEIRPFTELKIEQTFNKSIQEVDKKFFIELFKNRPELVPIARNPFLATLMIRYVKENKLKFPSNQAELYKNYISNRLNACLEKITEAGLTVENIIDYASDLSYYLFSSDQHGLEIKLNDVKYDKINLIIIEILVFAKIGRLSPDKRFSFVHRRFNEYFVVLYLIKNPQVIKLESIPTDSRWRDALVLYSEVADVDWAQKIAEYCWEEMSYLSNPTSKYYDPQFLRAIHSLRFLSEAFRSRKEAYRSFLIDLSNLVIENITSQKNILVKKYCVEATGLLEMNKIEEAIHETFKSNNSLLYEIAFKSSRHLAKISSRIEKNICNYILSIGVIMLLKKRKELIFSTSLSDAFFSINRKVRAKIIDYKILTCGYLFLSITNPIYSLAILATYIFSFLTLSLLASTKLERPKTLFLFRLFFSIIFISFPFSGTDHHGTYLIFRNIDTTQLILNCIFWIGLAMIIPFIDLYHIIKYKTYKIKIPTKYIRIPPDLVGKFLLMTIIPVLFLFLHFLIKSFIFYMIIGLSFFVGIIIVIALYRIGQEFIRFKAAQNFVSKNATIDRKIIFGYFKEFQFNYFRLKFVESLQNFSITPSGEWPGNDLPNHYDDNASILLANLEAQWIGLE